jgi:rhodanese-related sulfurtransferase
MKTSLLSLLVLSILGLGAISAVQQSAKSLPPKEFKLKLERLHGLLVDVRTPEEYLCAHIPGAININLNGANFEKKIDRLDKVKNYFLYCGTGVRSLAAMEVMKKKGFYKVFDLDGGLTNWEKYDLPMDGSTTTCSLLIPFLIPASAF